MREKELGREMGIRIMNLRMDRGYSREQLAEMSNISASFLYEIETNRKGFTANTLWQLSQALEVSSDYILFGKTGVECGKEITEVVGRFDPVRQRRIVKLLNIIYEMVGSLE